MFLTPGVLCAGKGCVYSFDPVGSYEREVYRAGGSAGAILQPLLDNQVSDLVTHKQLMWGLLWQYGGSLLSPSQKHWSRMARQPRQPSVLLTHHGSIVAAYCTHTGTLVEFWVRVSIRKDINTIVNTFLRINTQLIVDMNWRYNRC